MEAFFKKAPRFEVGDFNVKQLRLLAEGGFSYVMLVEDCGPASVLSAAKAKAKAIRRGHNGRERFALKRMIIMSAEQREEVSREVAALCAVDHPNVVKLLGFTETTGPSGHVEALLLLPLYERSAQDVINAAVAEARGGRVVQPFSGGALLTVASELAAGLQALHAAGYRHNDVKPANVLLRLRRGGRKEGAGRIGEVVLTDLGSAGPAQEAIGSRMEALAAQEWAASHTTAPYRAPELYDTPSECVLTEATDIWSLGCLLYAVAFGHSPFESAVEGVKTLSILSANFDFPAGHTQTRQACELIARMLARPPADRAPLQSALEWIAALSGGGDPFGGAYTVADPREERRRREREEEQRRSRERALQDKLEAQLSSVKQRTAKDRRSGAAAGKAKGQRPPRPPSGGAAGARGGAAWPSTPEEGFADFADFGNGDAAGAAASDPPAAACAAVDPTEGWANFGGANGAAPGGGAAGLEEDDAWGSFHEAAA